MKYKFLTNDQAKQEKEGRIRALERRHYLRTLDQIEAQAQANTLSGEEQKQAMAQVGQIMLDLQSIEQSLSALYGE